MHTQLETVAGRQRYLARPKTRASRRVVPLPFFARDTLASHPRRPPSDGFVFRQRRGDPWRRGFFDDAV